MNKKNIFLFLCVLFLTSPALAGLEVKLSRKVVPQGESFQMYLRQNNDAGQPDLSVLEKDFVIVEQRKSYKSSYINGKVEKHNENIVTLIPKKTGKVILPAIKAGKEQTSPTEIMVVENGTVLSDEKTGEKTKVQSDVFIRSSVTDTKPYVGQQLFYTVRLYVNPKAPLLNGAVNLPPMDGVSIEQWGEVQQSQAVISGQTYQVYEYLYLLFPQKAGEITLPMAQFQGAVRDLDAQNDVFNSPNDMFGFGGVDVFSSFLAQKNIVVSSKAITIDVQSKPVDFNAVWFPATAVEVVEEITPKTNEITLGEAVTRTVTIMANGVRDTQIPDPVFPQGQGYNQYAGKTDSKNLLDKDGLIGVKTRQVVFMPTQSGSVTLPEMQVEWFDVQSKMKKIASLPARVINVIGSATDSVQNAVSAPVVVQPKAIVQESKPTLQTKPAQTVATTQSNNPQSFLEKQFEKSPIRLFIFGILSGGISVVLLWILAHFFIFRRFSSLEKVAQTEKDASLRQRVRLLREVCFNGTILQIKEVLLNIAALIFPENPPLTLLDVAKRFDDNSLTAEIEKLNKALYSGQNVGFDSKALWIAFNGAMSSQKQKEKTEKKPVPPLYPN